MRYAAHPLPNEGNQTIYRSSWDHIEPRPRTEYAVCLLLLIPGSIWCHVVSRISYKRHRANLILLGVNEREQTEHFILYHAG